MAYESVNPFDGKSVKTFVELTERTIGSENCQGGELLRDMGIQEFVNKKLVRIPDMAAPLV
jgi:hypothetical protein